MCSSDLDDASAGTVDDSHSRFHLRQPVGVDQSTGLFGQGRVDGHEVACGQHRVEVLVQLDPVFRSPFRREEGEIGRSSGRARVYLAVVASSLNKEPGQQRNLT